MRIYSKREERTGPKGTPGDLLKRMGYELVQLGLRRRLTWAEAELVLEAIAQYDREEAARHNRRQEIIRNGGLPPAIPLLRDRRHFPKL